MGETVLILVRHGATRANVCRPHTLQGLRPDSELIEEGKEQARAAGLALRGFPIRALYCSPLRRAVQTAELIAAALGLPGPGVEAGLVEADVGDWTGLSWPEIERRWPEEFRAFRADAELHGYPGGEDLGQVRDRGATGVAELVSRHPGETTLVVGHGVMIRVLLAHWLGVPLRFARQLPQENAAFNVIEFPGGVARVRAVNVTHPRPLPAFPPESLQLPAPPPLLSKKPA